MSHAIATALSLAEFAPVIRRWVTGPSALANAKIVVTSARQITKSRDPVEMVRLFRESPERVGLLRAELLSLSEQLEDSLLKSSQEERVRTLMTVLAGKKNLRGDIMVLAAALGLVFCLSVLVFFKDTLPGEAVGIISTIAGIFGSCLKDAYGFEFGSSRGSRDKDDRTTAVLVGREN
ncbi:MAG: hypothetical protein LBD66_01350 [Holosporales bacterium]|jgi:hypothetical protein|nr:hypothetical protein [Holosporales bacterium]